MNATNELDSPHSNHGTESLADCSVWFRISLPRNDAISQLADRRALRFDAESTRKEYLIDTFDWRLKKQGLELWLDVDAQQWRFADQIADSAERGPAPWVPATIPHTAIREMVSAAAGPRALFPNIEVEITTLPCGVIYPSGQVYARGAWQEYRLVSDGSDESHHVLLFHLSAVPSRIGVFSNLINQCESLPQWKWVTNPDALTIAHWAGVETNALSVKPRPCTKRKRRARCALAKSLLPLADTMDANIPGILQDWDIEFLHDFRIACRRSRTLCNQLGSVLPRAERQRFKDDFRWLSRVTGAARDLDVMTSQYHEIFAPDTSAVSTELFRRWLMEQRNDARQAVLNGLTSRRFLRFSNDWKSFLRELARDTKHGPTVESLVEKKLGSLESDIMRFGKILTVDSPDEHYHELRKLTKKLRYLLDFYPVPVRNRPKAHSAIKSFQERLGLITDLCLQRDRLIEGCLALLEDGAPATHLKELSRSRHFLANKLIERKTEFIDQFDTLFQRYRAR